jgi:hypothetical protein
MGNLNEEGAGLKRIVLGRVVIVLRLEAVGESR